MIIRETKFNGQNWGVSEVQASRYAAGGIALRLVDISEGEVLTVMTVKMDREPADGCFWLKSWGENTGLAQLLGSLGLVEYTGEVCHSGYVQAIETKPKGELKDLIEAEMATWT